MINLSAIKATTLKQNLANDGMVVIVREFADRYGNKPEWADLDTDFLMLVIKQGDTWNQVKVDGLTQNEDGSATFSVASGGRSFLPIPPFTGSNSGDAFSSAVAEVIVTNDMITMLEFAKLNNDNVWGASNTFPINPRKGSTALATNNDDYITKSDLNNAVIGSVITDQVIIGGMSGEALSIGQVVYFKEADGKWYLADADLISTFDQVKLGFAESSVLINTAVNIALYGLEKNLTGLTPGAKYYISATAGAITTTPATPAIFIGWAETATRFIIDPLGIYQPTANEKAAMAGALGTPSDSNRYETENDTSNGAVKTAITVAFTASNKTISDSGNGFVIAGFKRGQSIVVSGSISNNGTYHIVSVAAGAIVVAESLVNESAGASVTLTAVTADKLLRLDANGLLPSGFVPSAYSSLQSFIAGASINAGDALHISPYIQTDGGIKLDNQSATIYSNATNQTKSITVASNSNRILLVSVLSTSAPSGVTYNSIAMTLVDSQTLGGGSTLYVYKLLAPSTGANNIAVTGIGIFGITGASMYNVSQATNIEVSAKANANTVSIVTLSQGATVLVFNGNTQNSGTFSTVTQKYDSLYNKDNSGVVVSDSQSLAQTIAVGTLGKFNQVIGLSPINNTVAASGGGGTVRDATIAISLAPATAMSVGVVPTNSSPIVNNEPLIDFIGIATQSASIVGSVIVQSNFTITGLTGLTAGKKYYLQDTNGAIGITRGTYGKSIGYSVSTTALFINPSKTMGAAIAKVSSFTYTAESDGFAQLRGANTIITGGVTYTGVASATMTVPVSKGNTYVFSGGADIYFTPLT